MKIKINKNDIDISSDPDKGIDYDKGKRILTLKLKTPEELSIGIDETMPKGDPNGQVSFLLAHEPV